VAPGLDVLFCGINPGLESARRGHHFARPGNRFWPALYGSGFTPELLTPEQDHELTRYGLGLTNVVDRASRGADDLLVMKLTPAGEPVWIEQLGDAAHESSYGLDTDSQGHVITVLRKATIGAFQDELWVLKLAP